MLPDVLCVLVFPTKVKISFLTLFRLRSPVLYPKYYLGHPPLSIAFDTFLRKPLGSISIICNKICKISNIYCKKEYKKVHNLWIIMHFWKKAPANSNMQTHFQNFHQLNVHSRKTENVQNLFKASVQNVFAKIVHSASFCKML